MLKKIPIHQLRLGMHLHALEGPWIEHPFWRTRFVLADPVDLKGLLDSGLVECWIDNARGLDVPPPAAAAAPLAVPQRAPQPVIADQAIVGATRFSAELQRAAAICQHGRQAVMSMFNEARMGRSIKAAGCLSLVEEISASVLRNPGALVSLARLKTKDDYTYMHSVAVCALMVSLGRQLGMNEDECRAAGLAGLVHDVGKALLPLDILNKPGKLTDDEFHIVRGHPERGHALLLGGQGVSSQMLDVALHHHERIDGTGYPHRLAGEAISRLARMAAVCDVYDAITSNRPYKAGWDPADSMARMASWKGHFDDSVFNTFVGSLGIYPTGSLVRLLSGLVAVVVEQNPAALLSPVVNAFHSTRSNAPIAPQRIDLAGVACSDRITGRESNADGRYPKARLDELWAGPEVLRRMAA